MPVSWGSFLTFRFLPGVTAIRPEDLEFPNTMTDIDYDTWMLRLGRLPLNPAWQGWVELDDTRKLSMVWVCGGYRHWHTRGPTNPLLSSGNSHPGSLWSSSCSSLRDRELLSLGPRSGLCETQSTGWFWQAETVWANVEMKQGG